jgi:hypothetical protein
MVIYTCLAAVSVLRVAWSYAHEIVCNIRHQSSLRLYINVSERHTSLLDQMSVKQTAARV